MYKSFIVLGFCLINLKAIAEEIVIHPHIKEEQSSRFEDLIEILDIAMLKTQTDFGPYQLRSSTSDMTESRLLHEVKSGNKVNVIWSSTSPQKEEDLRVIRIPLRKGLLGYRLSFIHKDEQAKFNQVHTITDLKAFHIGQGMGWGDIRLYENSDIIVEQAPYQSLFKMIAPKRFDLFPRGINEIYKELEIFGEANPKLAIEKSFAIYYPWPYYFFTSKNNESLALRIEVGLKRMIADGSFDRIFLKYNHVAIQKAKLSERKLIHLKNPFLPKNTPLDDAKLWYFPKVGLQPD